MHEEEERKKEARKKWPIAMLATATTVTTQAAWIKSLVLTMAIYACNRHHGWRAQAAWTNDKRSDTPRTRVGPGGREQTLASKSQKNT